MSQIQQTQTPAQPFPWNRVATLLGPFVASVSGVAAAWLLRHFPGMHIDKTTLATTISEAAVFAVAAAGTFALHHKWLSGWQQYEQSLYQVNQVAGQLVPGIGGKVMPVIEEVVKDVVASSKPDAALGEQAATNGQPAADAAANGSPGVILIDSILPALSDELASVPSGQGQGQAASTSRPDSAVRPDTPVGELQHAGI